MQWNSNYKTKFLLTFTMLSAYFITMDTAIPLKQAQDECYIMAKQLDSLCERENGHAINYY